MDNPNLGKVVQFTNITDKDFSHSFLGQPFFVKAHETVVLPWDLADHLATHLARRIFIDGDASPTSYDASKPDVTQGAGKPLYAPEDELTMKTRILGQTFNEEVADPKSEVQILAEKVAELQAKFGSTGVVPPEPLVAAPVDASTPPLAADNTELAYKDKGEVVAALEKAGVAFNPRLSKAKLEALLAESSV